VRFLIKNLKYFLYFLIKKPIKINKEITGLKYSIYFCIFSIKKTKSPVEGS